MSVRHCLVVIVAASVLLLAVPLAAGAQEEEAPTWTGWETCAECHDDIAQGFERTVHGRLASWELNGLRSGCEACHGPGSMHADTGEPEHIRSLGEDMAADAASESCLVCHEGNAGMEWEGSVHALNDVACVDCHSIHRERQVLSRAIPTASMMRWMSDMSTHPAEPPSPRPGNLAVAEACFDCHPEVRAKFQFSSHHPVLEGYMSCADCHIADGAIHGDSMVIDRTSETCVDCHPQNEGPWVFEHAPVEEDCSICHDPHGSVANSMLTQNEPFLCLQCHEHHFHAARLGGVGPASTPTGGLSQNPMGTLGFMAGYNTSCTTCHPAIHGSDLPSLSITSRGHALTR